MAMAVQERDKEDLLRAVHKAEDVFYGGVIWKFWHDQTQREGQLQVDIDHFLLEQYHMGQIPAVIRIWRNHPCLVLSRRDARSQGYGAAEKYFKDKNIPLYIRTSGGTVVPHGPGVLNISLIFSHPDKNITLEQSYILLCDLVAGGVKELGIRADVSEVAGAFCDGRFNLTIGGRKIGGTAQRIKRHRDGRKSYLSHMCLLLDVNVENVVQDISDFYSQCGIASQIEAQSITTLAREMRTQSEKEEIFMHFLKSFHKFLDL